jgi:hypothetical protein
MTRIVFPASELVAALFIFSPLREEPPYCNASSVVVRQTYCNRIYPASNRLFHRNVRHTAAQRPSKSRRSSLIETDLWGTCRHLPGAMRCGYFCADRSLRVPDTPTRRGVPTARGQRFGRTVATYSAGWIGWRQKAGRTPNRAAERLPSGYARQAAPASGGPAESPTAPFRSRSERRAH